MQLRRFARLTERGDTVVEVLICIAVIGLLLGGAFVLTNRSLQGTRAAQERLNGIKIVEGQLEQIKSLASTDAAGLFSAPTNFCINSSQQIKDASDATCTVGPDGNPSPAKEPKFTITASRTSNTFTVKTVWNRVTGVGQDNVEMKYNVFQ
jgi:type II secretory pathway pseudopilin PulG